MIVHFKFLQANLSDGKEGTFMDGPGRQLASLRHWLWVVSYEQIFFETRVSTIDWKNPSHLFLICIQFSLKVQCHVFVVANKEYENIYAQRSKYVVIFIDVSHLKFVWGYFRSFFFIIPKLLLLKRKLETHANWQLHITILKAFHPIMDQNYFYCIMEQKMILNYAVMLGSHK